MTATMIRYALSQQRLVRLIRQVDDQWLDKAKTKTSRFRAAHAFTESSSQYTWGDIKIVYMHVQHHKCAYCERRLGSFEVDDPNTRVTDDNFHTLRYVGRIEHDVEHYRPKNGVGRWPSRAAARERDIDFGFPLGDAFNEGYYLLAYQIWNYVTACKVCNTTYQGNYFPIAADRGPQSDNPRQLRNEKPYLLYPLGTVDTNPEQVITFEGLLPIPVAASRLKRHRAEVTIRFFELHRRDDLLRERAGNIRDLFLALRVLENAVGASDRDLAEGAINPLLSDASAHTNCNRAFHKLYHENRVRAKEIAQECVDYLNRHSP